MLKQIILLSGLLGGFKFEVHYRDEDHLSIRAVKDIPSGQELTLDYRLEPLSRSYFSHPSSCYLVPPLNGRAP